MKKILLAIILTPIIISSVTYLNYTPEDYCQMHEFALDRLQKEETELGMSGSKHNSLSKSEKMRLFLENQQYSTLEATYNFCQEYKIKCINNIGVSKWERFKTDIASGEFFD